MGIQGLLPMVKSIEKPVHLKQYAGMTLAVDGYVWLHRGVFSCAQELGLGQPTQKYVTYFMRQIEMFRFFGVKPYVVFDGGYLPSKAATEDERLSRREESKKQAMDLLKAGKSKQALEQFRKCVDVTPEMAHAVIKSLEASNVDFVVAPYEADAQLAYLEKHGIVDGIVTEDSDLLVFGCKRMIFKLDKYGAGVEILNENLRMVQEVSFHDWSMTEIRHMCILAGCDYLASIPGMGLKTAQRLLRKLKTFDKVIRHVRMENTSMKVSINYEESFRRADLTFLYARVYDPITKDMVHLSPVPEELQEFVDTDEYNFLGPRLEQSVVHDIAIGKLNPITKEPLVTRSISGPNIPKKPLLKFTGKENKQTAQVPQSSKSIASFFTKKVSPPVAKPKPADAPLDSHSVSHARDALADISSSLSMGNTPQPRDLVPHQQKNVVVVSRSRFFGFEPEPGQDTEVSESEPEAVNSAAVERRIDTWSPPVLHEDSGIVIGTRQEEEEEHQEQGGREGSGVSCPSLTFDMSSFPSQGEYQSEGSTAEFEKRLSFSSPSVSSSQEPSSSQETTLSQTSNKVVQGWREKFSHPEGSVFGGGIWGEVGSRRLGMKRAVQAASQVRKSFVRNSAGGVGIKDTGGTTTTTTTTTRTIGALTNSNSISASSSSKPPLLCRKPSNSVVRTTVGHPVYFLNPPSQSSSQPQSLSQGLSQQVLSSSSVSAVTSSLLNKRPAATALVNTQYPPRPAPRNLILRTQSAGGLDKDSTDRSTAPMLLNLDRFKYTPSTTITTDP